MVGLAVENDSLAGGQDGQVLQFLYDIIPIRAYYHDNGHQVDSMCSCGGSVDNGLHWIRTGLEEVIEHKGPHKQLRKVGDGSNSEDVFLRPWLRSSRPLPPCQC